MNAFPRLWAGTFIEAYQRARDYAGTGRFPRLRAGTFIEGVITEAAVS